MLTHSAEEIIHEKNSPGPEKMELELCSQPIVRTDGTNFAPWAIKIKQSVVQYGNKTS